MKSEYIHTAVGVIAVVLNDKRQLLLVLSQDRGWEPPMGFVEPHESPLCALQREVLEESGYTVTVTRFTGMYHCIKDDMPILSLCFLCEAGELIRSEIEESLAVQWVERDQVHTFLTYQPHLVRVADALHEGTVSVRDYQVHPFAVIRSWISEL